MVNHKLIRLPPIFAPKGREKKSGARKSCTPPASELTQQWPKLLLSFTGLPAVLPLGTGMGCLREPPERLAVPRWPVASLFSVLPSAFLLPTSGDESGAAAASIFCTQQSCAGARGSLWPSGDRQVMEPVPASSKRQGKKKHTGAQGCSAPLTFILTGCSRRGPPGAVNKQISGDISGLKIK